MSSEALDKTVITDNWQIFSKKLFQHFIHHKKILKVTKFQFKIICRSRVLHKNIPLWYIVSSQIKLKDCDVTYIHNLNLTELNTKLCLIPIPNP